MAHVEDLILNAISGLTPAQTRVARAVLAAYPALATRSASEIARTAGASPASVLRFVAVLGFPSLREFHEAVRADLDARARSPFETVERARADGGLVESVIRVEADNIAATLRRIRLETLTALRGLIMDASSVLVLGGRFSHAPAVYLHAHLRLIRSATTLLSTADVADQISHAGRGSCLILFDFRRYHPEARFAARYIKSRRGRVVLITDPYVSPASHHADHTLIADVEGPHLVDSYASVIALLDILVSDLVVAGGARTRRRIERVEDARDALQRGYLEDAAATRAWSPAPGRSS